MGAGASSSSKATPLSTDNLPKQLFVEGAGSVKTDGKFVLRTGNLPTHKSSSSGKAAFDCSAWFCKDDDAGCWMGFVRQKSGGDGDSDERKWVICTAQEILYMAPITDEEITPRQGRWELGDDGAFPPPTVNLQPLPAAFRLSGWKRHHDRLNGEYLPLDDASKQLNDRPIFKHTPVVGVLPHWDALGHQDKCRLYWAYGAWRIGNEEQLQSCMASPSSPESALPDLLKTLQSKHTPCTAFIESDATHPSAMSAEVVWKATASENDSGKDKDDFEVVEGVSLAKGLSSSIYVSPMAGDALTTLTVRPWLDTVEDLQAQAFASDTPSQRQQLVLDGKRLKDDGRVLALHGVVAECTIQLVMLDQKDLLDGLFDDSGAVGAYAFLGDPVPETQPVAFWGGQHIHTDGRVYMSLSNGTRAARFDPATNTWESFGDTFPETVFGTSEKWCAAAVSSIDKCVYQIPFRLQKSHRMLKVDPVNGTAQEVGEDVRTLAPGVNECPWGTGAVANADGIIFGMPCNANSVFLFDPRTNESRTFGEVEDTGDHKYWMGVLGPSGRYIFAVPSCASRVLCVDTQELTIELIGPDFGHSDGVNFLSETKWHRGALGADNRIYAMQMAARRMLRIDPAAKTASLFGPDLIRFCSNKTALLPGTWNGMIAGMDGYLYSPPWLGDHILCIDPFAGTVSKIGEALPPDQVGKFASGVRDKDGAIWITPIMEGGRMLRLAPRRSQTPLLTTLLQPNHLVDLREGLRDLCCYGPALVLGMWREVVRPGGDCALVCGLLKATSTVLPAVVTASIKEDRGSTAHMLLRTILALFPPQDEEVILETKAEEQTQKSLGNRSRRSSLSESMQFIRNKDDYAPAYEAIQALVTDQNVLSQCFACSGELLDTLLRIFYGVMSLPAQPLASKAPEAPSSRVNPPANAPNSSQQATVRYLEAECTDLVAALRAIRRAPPALSRNDRHRITLLSAFVAAETILQAPAPDAWQPVPASADDWCWPPAPLVPLRNACKLVQRLGPDTVTAMWPCLASAITNVLVRIVDAVREDLDHATDVLTTIFDRERKSSLTTYHKQLRRARRDPTFPEFKASAAENLKELTILNRKEHRVQTISSFPELYATAHALSVRFNDFLSKLVQKCSGAKALQAPLKGMARALEKLVLRPGAAAQIKAEGVDAVNATTLVDVLRGSLECTDFTTIVFVLDLLQMLDVDMGDPKKAKQQGWDLNKFQIRLIQLKDRFTTPTSGGWADMMVNFSFVHGDRTHHTMELQIQHAQMLVVRKEGKAHNQYNSFRSAFELLEAVGREPHDHFEETEEDVSPLQRLEKQMLRMQQEMSGMHQKMSNMQQEMSDMKTRESSMQQEIDDLRTKNNVLESSLMFDNVSV